MARARTAEVIDIIHRLPKPKAKRKRRLNQIEQIQQERRRQKLAGMRRKRKSWEKIALRYLDYYRHMAGHQKLAKKLAKEFASGAWLLAHEEGLSTNQWLWRESRRALGLRGIQPWTTVPYDVVDLDV